MELSLALFAVFAITFVGTICQSLAGMGFGMVSVPVFVLLFGPAEGVLWGNILGLVNAGVLLVIKHKDVEWKTALRFTFGSIPVVVVTVLLIRLIPRGPMEIIVGALAVTMAVFSVVTPQLKRASGPIPQYATGAIGGFLSATVAQSGPAMMAYAQATRWDQVKLAATLQPYFLALNLLTVPLKWGLGVVPVVPHSVSVSAVFTALTGIVVGTVVAFVVHTRIDVRWVRYLALTLATVGAVIVLSRGLSTVFA